MSETKKVLRQHKWTEAQLEAGGFQYYETIKRLVMARVITQPQNIQITVELLVAKSGDVVCYTPGETVMPDIDHYHHWPVRHDVFNKTYQAWDEKPFIPTPAQRHLMEHGCRPYFKSTGVWAQRLRKSVWTQSLESPKPALIPQGRWLLIGSEGEPYHTNDKDFRSRYVVPPDNFAERLYWATVNLFSVFSR